MGFIRVLNKECNVRNCNTSASNSNNLCALRIPKENILNQYLKKPCNLEKCLYYSETHNNEYIERIQQMSYSSLSDNGMLQIFSFLIK